MNDNPNQEIREKIIRANQSLNVFKRLTADYDFHKSKNQLLKQRLQAQENELKKLELTPETLESIESTFTKLPELTDFITLVESLTEKLNDASQE